MDSTSPSYSAAKKIVEQIQKHTGIEPKIAIVCGSGLNELTKSIKDQTIIPYSSLNGFPQTTVLGHAGNFVFGHIKNVAVVAMQGRLHQYEGLTHSEMLLPMRVLKLLKVQTVLLSNAAGGLSAKLKVGDFVLLKDHISPPGLCHANVLVGPNDDCFGPRFPATADAYDSELRTHMLQTAKNIGLEKRIHEGIYFHIIGPTFTTKAECRMMVQLGADVVGMSTIPEVFAARHCGMRVVAVSLVTDICNPDVERSKVLTHEEVLEAANNSAQSLSKLFSQFVSEQ